MTKPQRAILTALLALAVLQVGLLHRRAALAAEGGGSLAVGSDLSMVTVRSAQGVGTLLPGPGKSATVVLSFSSACPHCGTVAPAWGTWLKHERSSIRVLAVSAEALDVAMRYAADNDWFVEVASTESSAKEAAVRQITRRTPWLFVVDPAGKVTFEAHGKQLAALDSALASSSAAVARGDSLFVSES